MHHNERLTYGFIFLVLALIATAVWVFIVPHTKTTQIFLGNTTYSMTVAFDNSARDKILEQDGALKENRGVMVAYKTPGMHHVKPKSLHEKSDVVWLDGKKVVIYQVKGLPAIDVDKEFGIAKESQYILFFRAGTITQQKLFVGNTIDFDLNSLW